MLFRTLVSLFNRRNCNVDSSAKDKYSFLQSYYDKVQVAFCLSFWSFNYSTNECGIRILFAYQNCSFDYKI